MGFPNNQNSPAGALPSWTIDGYPINTPLGYQQLSVGASAVGLTVPTGATVAFIAVSGNAVRYRDDGTPPTAALGYPLPVGQNYNYHVALSAIEFIAQTGTATLDILYYK